MCCGHLAGDAVICCGECVEGRWQGGVAGPACWALFSSGNLDLFEWHQEWGPQGSWNPQGRAWEVLLVLDYVHLLLKSMKFFAKTGMAFCLECLMTRRNVWSCGGWCLRRKALVLSACKQFLQVNLATKIVFSIILSLNWWPNTECGQMKQAVMTL